jgi:spermidine/putrescine transport system permease protein
VREKTLARLLLIPGTIWLLLLFVVPLGLAVVVSFATTDIVGMPVYSFHPENYHLVFNPLFARVFLRSLFYAGSATVICLVLGYSTAYTAARFGGRYRNLIILLILLPFFVDYLVRIYSWIVILGTGGVIPSLLKTVGVGGHFGLTLTGNSYAVILGLVYNLIPLMILPLYVSIERMDPALIEAGKDLYGTPRSTFFHVTLRYTVPGIASGCLLVFLPATGDFATAQLLGGPQQYMIGNLIQGRLSIYGGLPLGAGLTVVLICVLGVVISGYMFIVRRFSASEQGVI